MVTRTAVIKICVVLFWALVAAIVVEWVRSNHDVAERTATIPIWVIGLVFVALGLLVMGVVSVIIKVVPTGNPTEEPVVKDPAEVLPGPALAPNAQAAGATDQVIQIDVFLERAAQMRLLTLD